MVGRPPRMPIPAELAYGLAWNEAERSGVDYVKLMGKCRERDVAEARSRVFVQLRAANYSLPQIADVWGMDHTSVMYGIENLKPLVPKPPKPPKSSQIKAERNAQICDLYDTGLSLNEVGQRFGITRERVRQLLVKAGKYDRHFGSEMPGRPEARERKEEYRKGLEERKAYRAARKAKIIELYHAGRTYKEIATEMGYANGHLARVIEVVRDAGIANRRPSMVGKKKRLTDEQKRQIGERYAAGDDYRDIAKEFDISPNYVSVLANAGGYFRPVREPKPKPGVDHMRHPGKAGPKILNLLTGAHWAWAEDDLRRVQEMSAAGASASEIGKAVGRSRNAIIGLWGRARTNGTEAAP